MIGGLGKLSRYLLAGAGVVGLFAGGTPASAQNVQQLEATMKAMQAQMESLQRQVQEAKAAASAAQAAAGTGEALDLKIKWKGAPELSSADGKFKMKVRGRVQADYNGIDQDFDITGRPDVNAAELRRARLGVEGVIFYTVNYKFEVDFANDETVVKDAYLEYTGLADGLGFRFGNFKTFNSIDQMTSSRFITFMERTAFVEAWDLEYQIGAAARYAKEHFTIAAGIFGPQTEWEEDWLQDVKTGAARLTVAPINREVNGVHQVVHLGASWRQREGAENLRSPTSDQGGSAGTLDPANDQFFRYRARGADLHLADRFVSTPTIFDKDTFWGVEGAVIWGPWHAVGEYTQLEGEVSQLFIGSDPTYNGWYVETGWFVTGETRSYSEGEFGRIKVKNPVVGGGKGSGWGAWQIAGRYDVIDLTDKATTIPNCSLCGEQATWLIGINWWLNDYTRFQFNYNESDIEGGPLFFVNGASANRNDGANIKGFGMRAQVDW